MTTYRMTTRTWTAGNRRPHTETSTGLLLGDIDSLKEAARVAATPGDTITHQVTREAVA